jgi:uncharacterized protein YndB with AHSA1/START domain
MADRIEKTIQIAAPADRVWKALTDFREFGEWFQVNLDGPFVVGARSTGRITVPGYEHVRWEADVTAMEPPRRFVFQWRPYAIDPNVDYSAEPKTTVEFVLAPEGGGTRLTVTESGFEGVPAHRRDEAFRMNDGGWAAQVENIKAHVER